MGDIHPYTAIRKDLIATAARGTEGPIPPPYHTYDVDMFYLLCRFDLAEARRALPAPLELADDGLGVMMVVNARRGWVVAPFTALVTTLQVKGFDGPDHYPGNYIHTAFYSGTCGELFGKVYNDRLTPGFACLDTKGVILAGTAGRDGIDTVRVTARRTERVTDELVSVNRYLSSLGNSIQVYSTSYSAMLRDIEDVQIEVFDTAPEPLRSLKPLEVVWPLLIEGMQLTFNAGHTLGSEGATVSADAALSSMFDLIGRFRRPAAVLTSSGRPLFMTREAEDLLGEGAVGLISSPKLLGDGVRPIGRLGDPRLLEHSSGRPIMAQVLPIMSLTEGEPLRLVLFTDPRGRSKGEPEPLLQVLGLTPAEARLAAMVGRGTSPQLAAPDLGVTRQTARSMMKTIFAKLEVSSQSQLAQLVTRLETA